MAQRLAFIVLLHLQAEAALLSHLLPDRPLPLPQPVQDDVPDVGPQPLPDARQHLLSVPVVHEKHRKGFMKMHAWAGGQQQSRADNVHKGPARPVASAPVPAGIFNDPNQVIGNERHDLIIEKLGSSYSKELRPSTDVYVRMSLRKLLNLDQINGVMSLSVWLSVAWPDYRLKYNATDSLTETARKRNWNSSKDYVSVPESMVWVPNVRLLNKVKESELMERNPRVLWYDEEKLAESGYNVEAIWPLVLHTECAVSLHDFPFDKQSCPLILGDLSATEEESQLHPTDALHKLRKFQVQSDEDEFWLSQVKVTEKTFKSNIIDSVRASSVVYELTLDRKPDYYLIKFVLPEFLLVLFGHCVYFIEQGVWRVSNGITIVLAVMTVSFLTISVMPYAPEVMWIERLQVGCYVLTCVPAFISVFMDHVAGSLGRTRWVEKMIMAWDVTARIVHAILVLGFYCYMFPSSTFGHSSVWSSSPDLLAFFSINVIIFVCLLAIAIVDVFRFKDKLKRAGLNEEKQKAGAKGNEYEASSPSMHMASISERDLQ